MSLYNVYDGEIEKRKKDGDGDGEEKEKEKEKQRRGAEEGEKRACHNPVKNKRTCAETRNRHTPGASNTHPVTCSDSESMNPGRVFRPPPPPGKNRKKWDVLRLPTTPGGFSPINSSPKPINP